MIHRGRGVHRTAVFRASAARNFPAQCVRSAPCISLSALNSASKRVISALIGASGSVARSALSAISATFRSPGPVRRPSARLDIVSALRNGRLPPGATCPGPDIEKFHMRFDDPVRVHRLGAGEPERSTIRCDARSARHPVDYRNPKRDRTRQASRLCGRDTKCRPPCAPIGAAGRTHPGRQPLPVCGRDTR